MKKVGFLALIFVGLGHSETYNKLERIDSFVRAYYCGQCHKRLSSLEIIAHYGAQGPWYCFACQKSSDQQRMKKVLTLGGSASLSFFEEPNFVLYYDDLQRDPLEKHELLSFPSCSFVFIQRRLRRLWTESSAEGDSYRYHWVAGEENIKINYAHQGKVKEVYHDTFFDENSSSAWYRGGQYLVYNRKERLVKIHDFEKDRIEEYQLARELSLEPDFVQLGFTRIEPVCPQRKGAGAKDKV